METVLPGLRATPPQPLPFAPSVAFRSYLLDDGTLIYGAATPDDLDGVTRRYLGHWHEAMFAGELAAPTLVHEADLGQTESRIAVDGTFSGRSTVGDDFEIVPIPGHTPGATAFLSSSGSHRVLFTSDSIYLDEGEWVVALDVSGSDRERFLESLAVVRELEYDVLVPWAATGGQPGHALTDPADARRRIDAIIERVRRGESR